jgi:Sigma 54 modulation protein / S30EA ribosomal protein
MLQRPGSRFPERGIGRPLDSRKPHKKMTELTMLIEVRTDGNIQGSEQFSDEVKTVVQTMLDRFGDRIRRIDVYLSDVTGNKAGHDDKCCKIEARRDGHEPIVVTRHETTMDQAIRGAVHSLKKSVESAFGKESTLDNLRDHH